MMSSESAPARNALAHESSPYLLQHAANPVNWLPWGEEAFARARAEDKPIFLSVGYSTCHWCHVMAHESFENEEIAALLNEHFVSVKVDREERPDVDRVYMTFVQATTGGGGWPMSVWLTPDLQPFFGGTYFPPDERWGRPGFAAVLRALARVWREDRARVTQQAEHAVQVLQQFAGRGGAGDGELTSQALERGLATFRESFDEEWGGFGGAPKFPRPAVLEFLWRAHAFAREHGAAENAADARAFAETSLRKMCAGGMHDHVGGGFHRYSVDRFWHVPHFEKMLYDQAQLVVALLEGFQITGDETFARAACDTLAYVQRDLSSPTGGFYSAEDADSLRQHGDHEKVEGAFYVWSADEIRAALGEIDADADAVAGAAGPGRISEAVRPGPTAPATGRIDAPKIFAAHFGVKEMGNAPEGSDPHGEFIGQNILIERRTVEETARAAGLDVGVAATLLEKCRAALFAVREKRPRPHRDEKILAAWNGLMISAFARAAQVFGEPAIAEAAVRAAEFIEREMWDATRGVLLRSWCDGRAGGEGFADDYAFLAQGLLDLYEATFDARWLRWAVVLQDTLDRLFWDENAGGYFTSSGGDASVLVRMKEDHDGAEPSPSSVAVLNLLRLGRAFGDDAMIARARRTLLAFGETWDRSPQALPLMLAALADFLRAPQQIVFAGTPGARDFEALAREVRRRFLPGAIVLARLDENARDENSAWLIARAPWLREMRPVEGRAAAYVCENFACQLPVTDASALAQLLERVVRFHATRDG